MNSLLPFANGIPSHDTFGAVFSNIDRKRFGVFVKWVQALQAEIPSLVAIDGKTVRRSKNGAIPPVHIISIWASDQNLVMDKVKTDVKSNEIEAIPELLEMPVLKKVLVPIDAMGCQKGVAERIILKDADYLLSVKCSQRNLYNELALVFDAHDAGMLPSEVWEQEFIGKDHGRFERRIYAVICEIKNLEATVHWPGLKCMGKVRSIKSTAR